MSQIIPSDPAEQIAYYTDKIQECKKAFEKSNNLFFVELMLNASKNIRFLEARLN